jgi:hypothetical protein
MRLQSEAILAQRLELAGPYRVPVAVPAEPVAVAMPEPVDTRSAVDRAADWLREALMPDPVPAADSGARGKRRGEAANAAAGLSDGRGADVQTRGCVVVEAARQ